VGFVVLFLLVCEANGGARHWMPDEVSHCQGVFGDGAFGFHLAMSSAARLEIFLGVGKFFLIKKRIFRIFIFGLVKLFAEALFE